MTIKQRVSWAPPISSSLARQAQSGRYFHQVWLLRLRAVLRLESAGLGTSSNGSARRMYTAAAAGPAGLPAHQKEGLCSECLFVDRRVQRGTPGARCLDMALCLLAHRQMPQSASKRARGSPLKHSAGHRPKVAQRKCRETVERAAVVHPSPLTVFCRDC